MAQNHQPVEDTQATAREVDQYFDGLLYDGMPDHEVLWVQSERERTHRELTEQALQLALGAGQHRRL